LLYEKTDCFLLLITCSLSLLSQTARTIKGKVTDESGSPLQGVSVLIRGTKVGTQTDASGNFSIKTTTSGKIELVLSFTGFTSQTITVEGSKDISIKLTKTVDQLDDVVVIGYQAVKKRDVLASVSSVSAKDLKDIPINSAAEALAGRLAGVQITTAEGSPDADVKYVLEVAVLLLKTIHHYTL